MSHKFSVIRLYENLDKWKRLHQKQIHQKYTLKKKYRELLIDYKQLLVENNELKRDKRNNNFWK